MSIGIVALLQWLVKRPIWLDFSVSSLAATCLLLLVSQISESSEFIYISDHTSIRTMEFNDKESRISLGSHLQYITDRREHWSLSEVISSEVDEKFINVNDGIPSLGLTDRTHWFRVALKYQGDEKEVTKAFEIAYPQLETVDFYELDTFGHVRLVQGGTTRPLVAPDVESRNFVSTLHFKQGETKWIYIKVDGIAMLIFPAYLWDINARRHSEKTEMIAFGLYYGIMAVMFLYNLFLYISARFRSYLYYICYIASVS
ncbi:MAG: hypothetical protein JKY67_09320, partial [Pseudomonadales bacterium]|nr:hypothetical protein [Pseudomonadales bacterium]